MTEEEWLAGNELDAMLVVVEACGSGREFRMFAAACCRRIWDRLDDAARTLLLTVERYCDGGVSKSQLRSAKRLLRERGLRYPSSELYAVRAIREAASTYSLAPHGVYSRHQAMGVARLIPRVLLPAEFINANAADYWQTEQWKGEIAAQANLIRDIFGNPFRPITFFPAWRTDTAASLAKQMYDAREFSAMPILADALQDAGCDNDDILNHCRGEGPHVRGCWVVDLVLGKE